MTRPIGNARWTAAAMLLWLVVGVATPPRDAWAATVEDATPPPVSGRRLSAPETILPADVLARVQLLHANVELLRVFMGRPDGPDPLLRVEGARPMEVYSQARNLELRANRLAFEHVRVVRAGSMPIAGEARTADVFALVDSSLASVLLVKRHLGISEAVAESVAPESTTPSEVFNATIAAGAEIDNLLERQTSPSDVFQLATSAIHIAAVMHATLKDGPPLPDEPAFEPNKMPSDVYMRLQRCYDLVRELALQRGLEMLEFDVSPQAAVRVSPTDVSDLAILVLEELQTLRALYPSARPPAQAYFPGERFPSHVYQRIGLLEAILEDLLAAGPD